MMQTNEKKTSNLVTLIRPVQHASENTMSRAARPASDDFTQLALRWCLIESTAAASPLELHDVAHRSHTIQNTTLHTPPQVAPNKYEWRRPDVHTQTAVAAAATPATDVTSSTRPIS